jgi:hypothetical protein
MNRDDIIRMAREAGFAIQGDMYGEDNEISRIERFANLVAAAEREACADIAENWRCNGMPRTVLADQIRERGAS